MNNNSLIISLTNEYPSQYEEIRQISLLLSEIEKSDDRIGEKIEALQELCNKLYNIKYTDEVLDLQLIINKYRYDYNITDPREVLFVEGKDKYVQ